MPIFCTRRTRLRFLLSAAQVGPCMQHALLLLQFQVNEIFIPLPNCWEPGYTLLTFALSFQDLATFQNEMLFLNGQNYFCCQALCTTRNDAAVRRISSSENEVESLEVLPQSCLHVHHEI